MKNSKPLIIILILMTALISSCRSDGPSSVDITGVWDGSVEDSYSSTFDSLFYEFKEDGTARMSGDLIESDGEYASLTWSLTDDYLEINDTFRLYSLLYAYDINADNTEMTLYYLAGGILNTMYEDYSFSPGNVVELTKQPEGTSLLDLEDY